MALIVTALTVSTAQADLAVRFIEGAPKDQFRIMNLSECPTGPIKVTIDLAGSAAGLIFDTTAAGAGVEVFQPLQLADGSEYVRELPTIIDGDTAMTLSLLSIPGDGTVSVTVDVDDTMAQSVLGQIRVAGSEIFGAEVTLRAENYDGITMPFSTRGRMTLPTAGCTNS
ncbi:MAG: aggregation factor core [Marinovum sp.]|nr:aggregation factor core [Marinovum sp.]